MTSCINSSRCNCTALSYEHTWDGTGDFTKKHMMGLETELIAQYNAQDVMASCCLMAHIRSRTSAI
uniref:Pco140702 n=1 Tax=Arundo donax TaxID=35708 RepID=A0A0A9FPR3_ARUDO